MPQTFKACVTEIKDYPQARLRCVKISAVPPAVLPPYEAGQYAMLSFSGFAPRPYSIGCAPGSGFLEFHIRATGGETSTYATHILKTGDTLEISAPYGATRYVQDCNRPGIAVAGGSGVACMKAIMETALADPSRTSPFYLYYGARTLKEIYLDDYFRSRAAEDARFKYIPVLSEELNPGYRHGLVGDSMGDDFPDLSGARIYGAGPVEMMRHLTELALAHGAEAGHIHTDLQQTASAEPESPTSR